MATHPTSAFTSPLRGDGCATDLAVLAALALSPKGRGELTARPAGMHG